MVVLCNKTFIITMQFILRKFHKQDLQRRIKVELHYYENAHRCIPISIIDEVIICLHSGSAVALAERFTSAISDLSGNNIESSKSTNQTSESKRFVFNEKKIGSYQAKQTPPSVFRNFDCLNGL